MARRELDPDHSAEAMPNNNLVVDPDLGAECARSSAVGNLVAVLRTVALTATPEIECGNGVCARKVLKLRAERGAIAAPARYEEQLRAPLPARS